MADTNKPTAPVTRRGIATARGTQALKFTHTDAKPNGLFLAHLDGVDVTSIKIGEESTGMPSFNGMEIPKLRFRFASNEADANKRKYVTLQFTPAESNVKTIPGGEESWKVDTVFDWVKHLLNVYVLKGRELTDEEATALALSFTDFDEDGQYVPVDSETVISAWKSLFDNISTIFNTGKDGKSYYKTSDNKVIPVWIKLLRYTKSKKKGWTPLTNGDLAFPAFVGQGCVELYKPNETPVITINPINECITPKDIDTKPKAQAPNMGMPGIPSAGVGIGMGSEMGGYDVSGGMGIIDDDLPEF